MTPWDHPRSRGVYPDGTLNVLQLPGSSPLARGLPAKNAQAAFNVGIIPARAGFTPVRDRLDRGLEDHPRSRGVYGLDPNSPLTGFGSSPLARGLQNTDVTGKVPYRIIPARAGFTSSVLECFPEIQDHPRSRGVYT